MNERIDEIVEHHPTGTEFLCECSRPECTVAVRLTVEEYQEVRVDPTRFFVASGHQTPEVERVVVENGGFTVVEKTHRPDLVARGGE